MGKVKLGVKNVKMCAIGNDAQFTAVLFSVYVCSLRSNHGPHLNMFHTLGVDDFSYVNHVFHFMFLILKLLLNCCICHFHSIFNTAKRLLQQRGKQMPRNHSSIKSGVEKATKCDLGNTFSNRFGNLSVRNT
jgi:hypothetical protein